MQSPAPPLLPILRTETQAEILTLLMVGSMDGSSISALANRIGVSVSTVQREVERLETAGIVRSDRIGRTRLIWIDDDSPYTRPLRELIEVGFGPQPLITEALRPIDGIQKAFIFGSWAQSATGRTNSPPNDIDLLIVGEPDRLVVYSALTTVEQRVHREIDVTFRSVAEWETADDPFVTTIRSRPLIELETGTA